MKRILTPLLWIVGIVSMILFVWFDTKIGDGRITFRIGQPTPWCTWAPDETNYHWRLHVLTPSMGLGVLSIASFVGAWKLADHGELNPPTK